jgi:hypothetical protein
MHTLNPLADPLPTSDDFGARVDEGQIFVPSQLVTALEPLSIRTAEDLIAFAHGFPSELAFRLGWTVASVRAASSRLGIQLRGVVDDDALRGADEETWAFGARQPPSSSAFGR